ncbi:MAG: hypothetical protein KME14_12250 [Tildeniella torsiva UHER 1998/13D]|jgi:hypothetical protein|nr:hypothetical protein [Tildeniella torsiva UHER 1998/13D]
MTSQNFEILNACRRGDPKAIASVIDHTLGKNNIRSKVLINNEVIIIQLQSEKAANKEKLSNWLRSLLTRLAIQSVNECHIKFTSSTPVGTDWIQKFRFNELEDGCIEKASDQLKQVTSSVSRVSKNSLKLIPDQSNQTKPISKKGKLKAISVLVLTGFSGIIFFHIWSEYLGASSQENTALNEYLETLMPYERDLVAMSRRHCSPEYSTSQIVQDLSRCPEFEESFDDFCADYSNEKVCRAKTLEVFCKDEPDDVLCMSDL